MTRRTKTRHKKKGIEFSINFIIIVIIAVVFLSLVLGWIQSFTGQIEDLSSSMIQEAQSVLRETFLARGGEFFIHPNRFKADPGNRIAVTAGMQNSAPDGNSHSFSVGIEVQKVPDGAVKSEALDWFDWISAPKRLSIGADDTVPITVTIPRAARTGVYLFRITACSDINTDTKQVTTAPEGEQCDSLHPNIWGPSSRDFTLEVG